VHKLPWLAPRSQTNVEKPRKSKATATKTKKFEDDLVAWPKICNHSGILSSFIESYTKARFDLWHTALGYYQQLKYGYSTTLPIKNMKTNF